MVDTPKEASAFLGKKLRKTPAADKEALGQLVSELDDQQFKVRDRARKELRKLGSTAERFLRDALKNSGLSEDGRKSIEGLLALLKSPTPEWLRSYRAIQVLELIESPEAAKLLQALAQDHVFDQNPHWIEHAEEANAALSRWKRRMQENTK
jgi:hypothetical protein